MAVQRLERLNLSSPPPPQTHRPFFERTPVIFYRAGWARPRRGIFHLGTQNQSLRWLNASVMRHERVPADEFSRYRYLLDVGGVSGTTWSALRFKLLTGSLVFKVELPWVDWWHHELQPWRDYIPVREDLADLHDHFRWAEANQEDAYRIAYNGALVAAKTSTVEAVRSGVRSALLQIERHASSGGDQPRAPWILQRFNMC